MTQLFDLTGKTAFLTGASKGMGLAMATALAEHGANVVISARRQETLDAAAAQINDVVGAERAHGISASASDKEQLAAALAHARDVAGPIDILVGNAGVNPHFGSTLDIDDRAYAKTMEVNVQSNLWLAQMVADDMAERGGGSMMFTSSIGAFTPSPTLGTYGTSKLALIGLVRNLALELGPKQIRVNAICPGLIRTDFSKALWDDPELTATAVSSIPLGRLGDADDFRGIAVYLASDASRFMTGQALTVCGGNQMWS